MNGRLWEEPQLKNGGRPDDPCCFVSKNGQDLQQRQSIAPNPVFEPIRLKLNVNP